MIWLFPWLLFSLVLITLPLSLYRMLGNPHTSTQYRKVLVCNFCLKTINHYLWYLSFLKLLNMLSKIIFFFIYLLNLYCHPSNVISCLKDQLYQPHYSLLVIGLILFKTRCHTHCVFYDLSKAFNSIPHRKP